MRKPLRISVVANDPGITQAFLTLSEQGNFMVSSSRPAPDGALDAVDPGTDVVVLSVAELDGAEAAIAGWIAEHPDSPVYAVSSSADLDEVRRMMRAGVADVFVAPLKMDEILSELEQVMEKRDAAQQGGRLVTFLNAKGGNGSTTIALNAAVELAGMEDIKVLLVDMDIQFGDAAHALDLHPHSTVMEALSQADRLDATLLESLVERSESGLDVLASPARLDPLDSVRARDIQRVLEVALTCYDIIVVDLPRVVTPWTSEVMRWSDHLFLVAQGCVSSVRDSKLLGQHVLSLGVASEAVHYVHNRAGARHTAVDTEQLGKALGSNRVVVVHNDYDVAIRASDMGKPVVAMAHGSVISKDIHRLAEVVAGLCGHDSHEERGLFSRLFGTHGEAKS